MLIPYLLIPCLLIAFAIIGYLRCRRNLSPTHPARIGFLVGLFSLPLCVIIFLVLLSMIQSSTGALWIFALPFYAAAGSLLIGTLAWSAAAIYQFLRKSSADNANIGRTHAVIAMLVFFIISVPLAIVAYEETWVCRAASQQASVEDLWSIFRHFSSKTNRFVLAALAKNPKTPPDLLLAIAQVKDPELFEKHSTIRDFLKSDFLAVQRRVIRNPNVTPEVLTELAKCRNEYILGDVAANRKTTEEVLRAIHARSTSDAYLLNWGLAQNPNTPMEILQELAKSKDEYTKKLAGNTLAEIGKANTHPASEMMRELARRISNGDATAFEELQRITKELYRNINYEKDKERVMSNLARMHEAFDFLGEEAGKGNQPAFEALKRALRAPDLASFAPDALGIASAAGKSEALEILLKPDDWGILLSSAVFALQRPAKQKNERAIRFLKDVLKNPENRALWHAANEGLK